MEIKVKHYQLNYLDEIKPYSSDVINDHKTQGEWKIHRTMATFFFLKILKKFALSIAKVITWKF